MRAHYSSYLIKKKFFITPLTILTFPLSLSLTNTPFSLFFFFLSLCCFTGLSPWCLIFTWFVSGLGSFFFHDNHLIWHGFSVLCSILRDHARAYLIWHGFFAGGGRRRYVLVCVVVDFWVTVVVVVLWCCWSFMVFFFFWRWLVNVMMVVLADGVCLF